MNNKEVLQFVVLISILFIIANFTSGCATQDEHTFVDYSSDKDCFEGYVCIEDDMIDCYDPNFYYVNDEFLVCKINQN